MRNSPRSGARPGGREYVAVLRPASLPKASSQPGSPAPLQTMRLTPQTLRLQRERAGRHAAVSRPSCFRPRRAAQARAGRRRSRRHLLEPGGSGRSTSEAELPSHPDALARRASSSKRWSTAWHAETAIRWALRYRRVNLFATRVPCSNSSAHASFLTFRTRLSVSLSSVTRPDSTWQSTKSQRSRVTSSSSAGRSGESHLPESWRATVCP